MHATPSTLGIIVVVTAFLTAFIIILGGPKRAGALYPSALIDAPPELKVALGFAVTAASCLVSGASFVGLALLTRPLAAAPRGWADALLFCGIGAMGVGGLTSELIWVWMLAPLERFARPRDLFRWHDANRFGAMLALRWTGAFLVFFLTFKSVRSSDMMILGVSLILYSLMLGFVDAAILRRLRPSRRAE